MPGAELSNGAKLARAAALLAVVAALFGTGWLLGLGPFADEELSRGELIARADQVCHVAREAFEELQTTPPQSSDQAAQLSERLIGIAEDENAEIAQLDGPDDLEPQVAAYLAARERAIELMRKGHEAAADDDPDRYERMQAAVADSQPKRARLAREIGFGACSEPLHGPDPKS